MAPHTYREEPVIASIQGRLQPDHYFPDVRYLLLLTAAHFYMLEPEYDGSFTEQLALPLGQVRGMERIVFQTAGHKAIHLLFFFLAGALSSSPDVLRADELEILLEYPPGSSHRVRFAELAGSMDQFLRTFRELREETAL